MSALKWIVKLGADAFRATKAANGKWHKAKVTPMQAAKLRKQFLLEGKEWPYTKPEKEKPPVKFKGHRRHRRPEERRVLHRGTHCAHNTTHRQAIIAKAMEGMEARIAAYRESRKRPEPSLYDSMFLDSTLIKLKYRPGGKPPKN